MLLTEDQVLALAPDDASRKAGRSLAGAGKWLLRAQNARALWGECQGSGKDPYRTAVDTASVAFKCSCPSRKFPCKHGLGLLLNHSSSAADFVQTPEPDWVTEWLDKRAEKAAEQPRPTKPVDTSARARRAEAREEKVSDGLADLTLWIKDIIRTGLLALPDKDEEFFDRAARRLVDAQAPGLASSVRALGALPFGYGDWQERALELLAELYLTARGWGHREGLSAPLLADLRTAIGFTQSTEGFHDTGPVVDVWTVLAKHTSEEGALTVEKHWLAGAGTGRTALFLQFLIRGEGAKVRLTPGSAVCAALKFYPSAVPMRVAVDAVELSELHPQPPAHPGWAAVCDQQTTDAAATPIATDRPYILAGLQPVRLAGQWWLADVAGHRMALRVDEAALWTYLAASGGHPLPTAVLGRERSYTLFGFWKDGRYHSL